MWTAWRALLLAVVVRGGWVTVRARHRGMFAVCYKSCKQTSALCCLPAYFCYTLQSWALSVSSVDLLRCSRMTPPNTVTLTSQCSSFLAVQHACCERDHGRSASNNTLAGMVDRSCGDSRRNSQRLAQGVCTEKRRTCVSKTREDVMADEGTKNWVFVFS